jgi:thiamine pyrophosphate-dependent acetolactate synthase large subunit-like protein
MMETAEVLKVFAKHRGDAIVIPGRGGRHWTKISTRASLDLPLGDPAMGGHASYALGLALAQPGRKVVVFDSEGDLLMGLGTLATIAEQRPENLYHFLLDNGCYATTGGQPVPNAQNVAYDALARAAGYRRTHRFENLERFAIELERVLAASGPVFAWLKIVPEVENRPIKQRSKWQARARDQVIADLQHELGIEVCGNS